MEELVNHLVETGYLKTPRIIEAFRAIDRADFVSGDLKDQAYVNAPLPIGWGQTISQPLTVAFMLELLQPEPGDKVLDIGAGSGWQTALLAYCAQGQSPGDSPCDKDSPLGTVLVSGQVFAIERIPELKEFGEKNVRKYNFIEKGLVEFICGDGSKGLPSQAPFDKIIAAASAQEIPRAWKEQLKVGGRLVTPVGGSIWLLIKKDEKNFEEKEYPGFAFVPLVED